MSGSARRSAQGHRNGALVGADQRRDLFAGNEALGLGAALLRIALVVGNDEPHLGASEAGLAGAPGHDDVEVDVVVDDIEGGVEGMLGVDTHLRIRARHRVGRADHDFRRLGASSDRRGGDGDRASDQRFAASDGHEAFPSSKVMTGHYYPLSMPATNKG